MRCDRNTRLPSLPVLMLRATSTSERRTADRSNAARETGGRESSARRRTRGAQSISVSLIIAYSFESSLPASSTMCRWSGDRQNRVKRSVYGVPHTESPGTNDPTHRIWMIRLGFRSISASESQTARTLVVNVIKLCDYLMLTATAVLTEVYEQISN